MPEAIIGDIESKKPLNNVSIPRRLVTSLASSPRSLSCAAAGETITAANVSAAKTVRSIIPALLCEGSHWHASTGPHQDNVRV